MGNQTCQLLLDGAAGEALREMTGPSRIPITDRFWFELLKVQLPGVREAGFFDKHYEQPEVLDAFVRDAYFLQLVATNEHSGNFRTFLRFWARLLHYYRTSPRDAKPCGAATILSLSLICRCLLKHFASTFSAPELLFQLEQAPHDPAPDVERQCAEAAVGRGGDAEDGTNASGGVVDATVLVSYRGRRLAVRLPTAPTLPSATPSAASCAPDHCSRRVAAMAAAEACLAPFCTAFPEDAELLRVPSRCAFRAVATGETFGAMDLLDFVQEDQGTYQEFVICPCGAPNSNSSVVRSVFREVIDFLVSSSFGAVSGAVPSPLGDGDSEEAQDGELEGQPSPIRNLSTAPHTMQLQAVLLEIVLALCALVEPRYGLVSDPIGDARPASRTDFCAPFLFAEHEKRVSAAAANQRKACPVHDAPQPPAFGEFPMLPFFTCLMQVLEDGDEQDCGGGSGDGSSTFQQPAPSLVPAVSSLTGGTGGVGDIPSQSSVESVDRCLKVAVAKEDVGVCASDGGSDSGVSKGGFVAGAGTGACTGSSTTVGRRAEALLATLLNCIWLQPHAASLPRPPQEVVRLLSGVALPLGGQRGLRSSPMVPEDDAAADVLPAAADEQAAARAATGAARHLATRALLVLLMLLFHSPEDHPVVGQAFASLADPLLGERGRRHTAAAAPLNFTQLLKAVLGQLREGLYPLVLYCLVQKNTGFRQYCLCRADADAVLIPMLEVLHALPMAVEGRELAQPPPSATALLLTLLTLTGDRAFCEGASRARLADGGWVLRHARPLQNVAVSSLLVIVLLRVGHWNFASCRDPFFNRAVAGILANLARHGIEHVHWYAASRMLEVATLLAKNALKGAQDAVAVGLDEQQQLKQRMIRELLRSMCWLMSGCLRVPAVAKNCALVYALQRVYPVQFVELEEDDDLGPALRHVRAVSKWFQGQCPANGESSGDEGGSSALDTAHTAAGGAVEGRARADGQDRRSASGGDHESHVALLEVAASRLPGAVDALAAEVRGSTFVFSEHMGAASAYYLPVVWRASRKLLPDHVCWSQPRAETVASSAR